MRWRQVLADLAGKQNKNQPFDINGLILVAKHRGLDLQDRSARERIRSYVEHGFLQDSGGLYRVTDAAIRQFGLLDGNEAERSDADEASETDGGGL